MRAYAYTRVSGQSQIAGDGFDRQIEAILTYCGQSSVEIVDIYREEAVSGTADIEDRPAFMSMVGKMLDNGVKTVIVEGLDRLAREYRIQETLLVYLASKGLTLISARTEENVTEAMSADPMKRALIQIQGVFAELEKGLLVKKLRHARDKKREENGKCEGRKGLPEKNPDLWEKIKRMRMSGASYGRLADRLNEEGLLTVTGRPWTENNVRMLFKRNADIVFS